MDKSFLKQEVIGKEFDDKLNDVMAEYFSKRKWETLGYLPRPGVIGMVHILEDGMVKKVGGSDPFDIINDNWGKMLASQFCVPTNVFNDSRCWIGQGTGLRGTTGTYVGTVAGHSAYYGSNQSDSAFNQDDGGSSYFQIGSGLTAPTETDYEVETPFVSAPEANKTLQVGVGGYSPSIGRVSQGTNIGPTLGGGTINELCLFSLWNNSQGTAGFFMTSRDAISPGVDFVTGETIFAQYFWQI